MSRLGCLLLIWAISDGVYSKEEHQNGFVQPLDFGAFFGETGSSGISSLASSPIAAAMLRVDKSQYPQLFDTVVSSSIDNLQRQIAPKENIFSAENFGFNPIASSSYFAPGKAARVAAHPERLQQQQQRGPTHLPLRQGPSPARYDIHTVHDADYKVYKPEEEEQGEEILAALKKNPSVSSYFQPALTNVEVAHPIKYRKQEQRENSELEQNYKPNAYISGPPRIRRYTGGKRKENLRTSSAEEDDPYEYKADYVSRPKAFDGSEYRSDYKEEKDPNKDYEYPYAYDSGYDTKEYDRIKELSERQAAEIKQNPGNCKEVKRDGMSCMVCKDPKTKGNYESCSYITEPKNNKYAYSKEKKFDSNDEPEEPERDEKPEAPKKIAKYEEAPEEDRSSGEYTKPVQESGETHGNYKKEDDDSDGKYKAYYVHQSKPTPSEKLKAEESDESEEKSSSLAKPYNYKQALPGFYSDNEPKKDVEHVLAEFKKKDRSTCKKVHKNGMTCFQCIDKSGLKNEECMFVSESAPKRSHLAYQEVKEFTSQPPTLDHGNEGAESRTITTNSPQLQKSAAYIVAPNGYGKKLKRKKAQGNVAAAAATPVAVARAAPAAVARPAPAVVARPAPVAAAHSVPLVATPYITKKVKRSVESEADERAEILDETNIAPPEEFAGDNSKGAFWSETMPRYSAALGVTLPEFMLARSDHEASFDELVAGA